MTGAGPLAIREAARRVYRDVKGVHGDVHSLLNAGILQKTEQGLISFPLMPSASTSCCMLPKSESRPCRIHLMRLGWPRSAPSKAGKG